MKKLVHLVLALLTFSQINAQMHEVGVFAGGSNPIADVGKSSFIAPNSLAIGLLYKWNKSKRHAWRFSILNSNIKGNDANSDILSRKERGFEFENRITQLSAGLEFNFFDFDLHQNTFIATPYIHTGVSYFKHDNLYYIKNVAHSKESSWDFSIPMTIGVKAKITPAVVFAVETNFHYSFTDDLDGSFPKNPDLKKYAIGNIQSNDWYTFTGVSLTYTFGENPCYCKK